MKVLHLSYHCCVRVIKEATLIQNSGLADCYFMQHRLSHAGFLNGAPWLSFWPEDDEGMMLKRKLGMLKQYGIDLVHVHNEPSWLVQAVKKVHPDMPVIFDAHDLQIIYGPGHGADDRVALQMADAFIFTSKAMMEKAKKEVPRVCNKPHTIVYSKVLEDTFPRLGTFEREEGICYQGGLWDGSEDAHTPFPYRDWRSAFKKVVNMGIPVHVFPASNDVSLAYKKTGAFIYPRQEYSNMLANMNRYDWSLIGAPDKSIMMDTCMPNKLFESLAAGIPVIVFNAAEIAEFVAENNVGVVINSLDEIPEIYHLHKKYRPTIEESRYKLAGMFSEMEAIHSIYEQVWTNHQARKK